VPAAAFFLLVEPPMLQTALKVIIGQMIWHFSLLS